MTAHPSRTLLAAALLVFAGHAALLADWVVDDAGISFAYARNLAHGAGLVAQPGAEPVEGFSNPLWTLLIATLMRAGAFHPVWTPKLLSSFLVAVAFACIACTAPARGAGAWLVAAAPLLLALNTSFVVWTTSGLENALLAALAAASVRVATRFGSARKAPAIAGVVAGLLALTRPDGAVYGAVLLALLLVLGGVGGGRRLRPLLEMAATAAAVAGPYLLFRRLYYGDWLPNSYYAKVQDELLERDPLRVLAPLADATGVLAPWLAAASAAALLRAALRRSPEDRPLCVLAAHLAAAAFVYVWLPPDWMGEHRFATPFFLYLYWLIGHSLGTLIDARAGGLGRRFLAPAALLLLLAETTRVHADRSLAFSRAPTVPFARIAEFARGYEALAAQLPAGRASLLLPDLGGTLYEARRLTLVDLAGLCDRTVARTLISDRRRFHEYVFAVAQPTFVHVHGSWAGWAALHSDPRFARDYAPLHEDWTAGEAGEPRAGDYVRREALTEPAALATLRAAFLRQGLARPLP